MVVTFLPYPDIEKSLQSLDRTRISKQKLEASQILDVLEGRKKGWANHPATKMWVGYIDLLRIYYNKCIEECERRGFSNSMKKVDVIDNPIMPWWWGWEEFHRSHQASLTRKHPCFYTPIFNDLDSFYLERGYIWPSRFDSSILNSITDSIYAPINKDTMKSASKSKELLYTVPELKKMCKERDIKGYSKLKKAELLTILDL